MPRPGLLPVGPQGGWPAALAEEGQHLVPSLGSSLSNQTDRPPAVETDNEIL